MSAGRPFLTAEWRHVALVTYDIDPPALSPFLPPGCELDLRDGRALVSFVMFDFRNTRVKGIRWPGYVNFPEINLRFYVRHAERRGVSFIRELVPKRLIAWIARTIYNEPYAATEMHSQLTQADGWTETHHRFYFGGRWHTAAVRGRTPTTLPPPDSAEHFFKEHEWGFGRSPRGQLRCYRVLHPPWQIHPAATAQLDVDFGAVYGARWSMLNSRMPYSVVFAAGSPVSVYPHTGLGVG